MKDSYGQWQSKAYLKQYYSTDHIAEDELHIFQFILKFLKRENQKFDKILDVGCGPTIHHVLPFVPLVDEVYLADYLKENLDEIDKWLKNKKDAHDWSTYIKEELDIEGKDAIETPQQRTDLLREKIVSLLRCDVFQKKVIPIDIKFSLVTSFFCVDCATSSKKELYNGVRNISELIEPSGWIILSALRNTDKYFVNGKQFPSANVSEDDVKSALEESGFHISTIEVEVRPVPMWEAEGFNSIVIACAQRK